VAATQKIKWYKHGEIIITALASWKFKLHIDKLKLADATPVKRCNNDYAGGKTQNR
jgi:hypothetical protein